MLLKSSTIGSARGALNPHYQCKLVNILSVLMADVSVLTNHDRLFLLDKTLLLTLCATVGTGLAVNLQTSVNIELGL